MKKVQRTKNKKTKTEKWYHLHFFSNHSLKLKLILDQIQQISPVFR